ncbi:MAG TPA: S24 family peptidase [Pyrinomonadaceae bacterium]|jgi:SOS-response transcriptional repressor LexA
MSNTPHEIKKNRTSANNSVIPFPTNIRKFRAENSIPKRISTVAAKGGLVSVTVSGDGLKDMGTIGGDQLLCRTKFSKSDLRNGKLVVAQLPCLGLVVKFYYQIGGRIFLRSANKRFETLIYDADQVGIKAVIVQSTREWS